jgi:ssDNA-binding replication factor A large subunit
MRGLDIVALVVEKTEPTMRGNKLHSLATLEDHTGKICLNLWRQQVNQVKLGDVIKVESAFTREWGGEIQLSSWKDLEVL